MEKSPKTARKRSFGNKLSRELIVYLIVGVMTTIFSWGACFIAKLFLDSNNGVENFIINTIGWVAGVGFAYPLNRKWVFQSTNSKIFSEFMHFAASRLSTWILDILIMWFFVNVFPLYTPINAVAGFLGYELTFESLSTWNYWIVKVCISAVLVTVLNYVFSKLLIFNKKEKKTEE